MKKVYIKPAIEIEVIEGQCDLMTGSDKGICQTSYGENGLGDEVTGQGVTVADDTDEWELGAKSSGFYDSWEEEGW